MPGECGHCSNPSATLQCSACHQTHYCNVVCQQKDWRFHRAQCRSRDDNASYDQHATLPVEFAKDQILDTIEMNRVTYIFGPTGCGKSSQVPKILYQKGETVLCTQPRRLAVICVARRVAEEMNERIGNRIGLHVGRLNVSSNRTKMMFATSGMVLECLRSQGIKALDRYSVIVLDEVHERSVENDLVLACVKELMRDNKSIRLVLMSATGDVERYNRFFGAGQVKLVAIQGTEALHTIKELYLEDGLSFFTSRPDEEQRYRRLLNWMQEMPEESIQKHEVPEGQWLFTWLDMMARLVWLLHVQLTRNNDKRRILIFLPTYRYLEMVHTQLEELQSMMSMDQGAALPMSLHVLHSSVDVNDAVHSFSAQHHGRREVYLATNVAESSVTLPPHASTVQYPNKDLP